MADEKINVEVTSEDKKDIKMSRASRTRKTITYLQKKKDKGEKIVQMCPATLGPWFAMAAEMADCDILRAPAWGTEETVQDNIARAVTTIHCYRKVAPNIHINYYMETPTYASKERAMAYGAEYMCEGADSVLPMGISNETLKYMADNYIVVFGHVGGISGWQANATGFARVGKTAEDAMRIYRWAYEYQENGMRAMTIELTPIEVANAIAKKLRVPVISIAAGAAADGSEMVDMDTFGMMPSAAIHAKKYADFFNFATSAYANWANDVRTGAYPEDKHGYHMDPAELDKFLNQLEKL